MTSPSTPSQPARPAAKPGEPYCSNCGYILTGLTDSVRCPECGKPIVEVLTRASFMPVGKRYRSEARLFGLPVIDIALGPHHDGPRGRARGIIAIGDIATGWLAFGGVARGIVAIGGVAVGVIALGGLSVGLLGSLGGMAVSVGLSVGGGAIGALAAGGLAVGIVVQGGLALGVTAQGGLAVGLHVRDARSFNSASAVFSTFERLAWFFGPVNSFSTLRPAAVVAALAAVPAAVIGLIARIRLNRDCSV